jgi:uncharacterized protein YecE (DUF72 family)
MAIKVGIGSWADDEYVGVLYPEGTVSARRLAAYAERLDHVEVNSTLYATPRATAVAGWLKQTGGKVSFDVKLHRALTQAPASAGESKLPGMYVEAVQPLVEAGKFGTFFLILNPSFGPKRNKLEELDALTTALQPHRLAVELRNRGWVDGEQRARTLEHFRARGLVWIAVDMPAIEKSSIMPAVDEVTNPTLAYLRLHGRNPRWLEVDSTEARHTYEYTKPDLEEIAGRVRKLSAQAQDVHVILNNHASDFAPKGALALKELIGV